MNEIKTVDKKKKFKIFGINMIIFAVLFVIAIVIIKFPDNEEKIVEKAEFSDVSKICELATLKCYYHDVAEFQKDPDGLFKYGLFQYGAKKMWLEYNGIVKIGIDVGQVKVEEPTEEGVVRIYVPQATILDVYADKDTISDPIEDNGKFTEITADEKAQAFSAAQATMKENANQDSSLLNQARNNAKELLKQYVVNVGKQIGQKYSVEWIEDTTEEEEE